MVERTRRSTPAQHSASTPNTVNETDGSHAPARRKPGPTPGTEAAKRGGTAAREKYGREFFRRIGAKGGSTARERHGPAFYAEIGQRGGETTKQRLGSEHYARIGRIGGLVAHVKRSEGGADGRHDEGTTRNADNASR